jgi:hypothetical protein
VTPRSNAFRTAGAVLAGAVLVAGLTGCGWREGRGEGAGPTASPASAAATTAGADAGLVAAIASAGDAADRLAAAGESAIAADG